MIGRKTFTAGLRKCAAIERLALAKCASRQWFEDRRSSQHPKIPCIFCNMAKLFDENVALRMMLAVMCISLDCLAPRYPCTHCKALPVASRLACREKCLELELQYHDHDALNDFNTLNSALSRQNDLQKLFTKGNGPRPTLINTESANPEDLQRDTLEAIRCRPTSSSPYACGRWRNRNTGRGLVEVIMPSWHGPQRPELLQREDGSRGEAGQRVPRVAVVVSGRDEGFSGRGGCRCR